MTPGSLSSLRGRTVSLSISEPWEMAGAAGTEPLLAEVLHIGPDQGEGGEASILVRLKRPFRYDGSEREYFVAATRHEGDNLQDLLSGKAVVCNLTAVSASQAQSAAPLDLTAWRGGLALVGTLEIA
jgi:hypothetical protein